MSTKYFCAHCDQEFVPERAEAKPRCPKCMRRGAVEPLQPDAPGGSGARRGLLIAALLLLAAGLGFAVYRSTQLTLEETPPLRPLEPAELAAYLERDQVRVGTYESMFALAGDLEGWPESAGEVAKQMRSKSSTWSLELTLPRETLTAEQTLGKMGAEEARAKYYPLELATAMTALLRERGLRAMVAEVWEFDGAQAPADPSGVLGYFVTAVYDDAQSEEPSAYFDPWGGRGEVRPTALRVLRDTEVLAAALGTEAVRLFSRSGDGPKALPLIEAGLALDPLSPSLRVVHGTVLVESGGTPQAIQELEAAIQLRPDGPRQLNMVQLHLAQAGMLEMNGRQEAAEAQFTEGHRIVADVLQRWPRYGKAHVTLATVHLSLDEAERARVELETAEALSPDAPLLWLVWAQYDLANDDPIAASAKMKRAVQLDPDNWQLRIQAARIFQGAGDEDAARESVEAGLAKVPAEKRAEVRQYLERNMGPGASDGADPPEEAETGDAAPALILGDPSNLQLRDPDLQLKLDLDE